MKRWIVGVALVLALVFAIYWLRVRDTTVEPTVLVPRPAARIGSGADAVAVSSGGEVLTWYPAEKAEGLPLLPLEAAPKGARLRGPALQQVRVLGAVPPALRGYVERSYYGESGVDVVLDSGIELRFGDDSQAARKWRAAAAVLADPEVEALDYVDLHAPSRPAFYGSGHSLPPVP